MERKREGLSQRDMERKEESEQKYRGRNGEN